MILIYNFIIWIFLVYIINFLQKYSIYRIKYYIIPMTIITVTIINYMNILIFVYFDESLLLFSIINYSICNILLREFLYITDTWKNLFSDIYMYLIIITLIISIFLLFYWFSL